MRPERTACILCSRNCGLAVEIDGENFTRIRGDEDHPVSRGYICQKAARLQFYQQHDDRLRFPLRREADGSFVRVTWQEALDDIARRLLSIREKHGGQAFVTVGGGGQGNHLGGAYLGQVRAAMRSRYHYSSLAQEKTGDFWLNGRLFGSQACHTTEDVEHADFVMFIGCNPFQSHGIRNARDTLRELNKDPNRTMVVIDPRRTETAKLADIHLQVKPGTDAYLMAAVLAIIVREGLHNKEFLSQHCTGFDAVEEALLAIPVADYVARADVPLGDVERVARGFATARSACVRVDLGVQHTLHTTLNGYCEKLLYLITGNFGIRGGNNLHSSLIPMLGNSDERNSKFKRTAHHKMFPIAGMYPPSILPDEILHPGEDRVRAVFVDSSNPLVTWPDTQAYEKAFQSLELLVVVDVAMTETARLAHYVLPAASQFEKWEFTGFNLEFPENAFHLRHPLFPKLDEALTEPEIYTRLLETMGKIPSRFRWLRRIAGLQPKWGAYLPYIAALGATLSLRPVLAPYAASILYRTLGPNLPDDAAGAALLLPLAIKFANDHSEAVRRAGHLGNRLTKGSKLFDAILERRSGTVISVHRFEDTWTLIKHKDRRVHLDVPEMLEELRSLSTEVSLGAEYPFILAAGERRTYNANQIYRNPSWRKLDPLGAMRIHPLDAAALDLTDGIKARCTSLRGSIEVDVQIDDSVRRGMVILPHGYGMRYRDSDTIGPEVNRLTWSTHCDPLTRTPFHKYVPVRLSRIDTPATRVPC